MLDFGGGDWRSSKVVVSVYEQLCPSPYFSDPNSFISSIFSGRDWGQSTSSPRDFPRDVIIDHASYV
jgi:hypothetical protein